MEPILTKPNLDMLPPTEEASSEWSYAYAYFNHRLFGSGLPPCLITMQRKNRAYGYFSPARWVKKDKRRTDEIAMNPQYFAVRLTIETLSTLVHEMVHLQQEHFGKPGRRGYHNREWANMMIAVGLMPSNTGEQGGKQTGEKMSHYIEKNGRFEVAAKELLSRRFDISWVDRYVADVPKRKGKTGGQAEGDEDDGDDVDGIDPGGMGLEPKTAGTSRNKVKYTCAGCKVNAWGKPGLKLICGDCGCLLDGEVVGAAA